MTEKKSTKPEDSIVREMIKQLQKRKIYQITKYFQYLFMKMADTSSSWRIMKLVFLRNMQRQKKYKKFQGYCTDVRDVEVVPSGPK